MIFPFFFFKLEEGWVGGGMRGSSNTVFEKNDALYLAFLCYVNHLNVFILLPFYSDCEGVPCSYTVIFSIKLNTRVVFFFFPLLGMAIFV